MPSTWPLRKPVISPATLIFSLPSHHPPPIQHSFPLWAHICTFMPHPLQPHRPSPIMPWPSNSPLHIWNYSIKIVVKNACMLESEIKLQIMFSLHSRGLTLDKWLNLSNASFFFFFIYNRRIYILVLWWGWSETMRSYGICYRVHAEYMSATLVLVLLTVIFKSSHHLGPWVL